MTTDFAALQALLKQKKNALKGAGRTISPKPGKSNYVLLPPWHTNGLQFWHDFGQHYIKDETDKVQAVYVCTHDTFGRPCPICNGLAEAQRTIGASNPAAAELIKKARSGTKYLVNVLALDSDTPDEPQVLALGKKAFAQLVTATEEWGAQLFDASNPQIFQIERTGTTQNDTTYTVTVTPRRHAYKKAVKPIDLGEFVQQESEEAEKKALLTMKTVLGTAARLPAPAAVNKDVPRVTNAAAASTGFTDVAAPTATAVTVTDPALGADIEDFLADLQA